MDYDTALVHYERALHSDPSNTEYKYHDMQMHYTAGQFHIEQGQKALNKGDLQQALAEFQKAQAVDPSNSAADQQVKRVMDMMAAQSSAAAATADSAHLRGRPATAVGPAEAEAYLDRTHQLENDQRRASGF